MNRKKHCHHCCEPTAVTLSHWHLSPVPGSPLPSPSWHHPPHHTEFSPLDFVLFLCLAKRELLQKWVLFHRSSVSAVVTVMTVVVFVCLRCERDGHIFALRITRQSGQQQASSPPATNGRSTQVLHHFPPTVTTSHHLSPTVTAITNRHCHNKRIFWMQFQKRNSQG